MWWNRNPAAFWGGVLVILGVLFLLGNLNVNIRWDLIWPVFLIALGVWLIAARIGPGGAHAEVDSAEPRDGLEKAKLDVAVGAGRIDVRSAALGDHLYQVHVDHAGSPPEIRLDRDTGTVRISTRSDWFVGARRMRIEAQLTDAIPWEIVCRNGAGRVTLSLAAPKGVVPVRVEGGALRVEITRPPGAAIKVQASGGAVNLSGDGSRQEGIGNREWRSSGFDSATDRYEVTVSGGALNVTVSER